MENKKKSDDLSFEEAMKKLEDISVKLENGDISLEESIDLFTKGMELSRICSKMLENAENKITMLVKDDNKNLNEVDFDE